MRHDHVGGHRADPGQGGGGDVVDGGGHGHRSGDEDGADERGGVDGVPPREEADRPGRGVAWRQWDLPDASGFLKLDERHNMIGIHCRNPRHGLCRLNRSLNPGTQIAAGRPIGFLLAWHAASHRFSSQEEHMGLSKRSMRLDPDISFERRSALRTWAQGVDSLNGVFELERDPYPGEGDEPEGHVYTGG